jgi:uncharacterized protein (TIGR03790 family)
MPSTLPTSPYADDPARWLVVCNSSDADSLAWADDYIAARGVPTVNRCALPLPTGETITSAQYASLSAGIGDYLAAHNLTDQVLGILLGYRVPGVISGPAARSVASMLHAAGPAGSPQANPLASTTDTITRPTTANLQGLRLVSRIDAPSLTQAKALVDRATILKQQGLGDGLGAGIWLDPWTMPTELTTGLMEQMFAWSRSLARQRSRLPLYLSAPADPEGEVGFAGVHNDGFYWGWQATATTSGFFTSPAGRRVFAFELPTAGATALALRQDDAGGPVSAALAAGYAAAAGSVAPVSVDALPAIAPFMEALRRGWTLAEAWFVACPWLRREMVLVGDPLLNLAFPRAGWDLFGPLARLEDFDAAQPLAHRRADERTLALELAQRPSEGAQAFYVVRAVDHQGRSEAGVTAVCVTQALSAAAALPAGAIWPDAPGWPVARQDQHLVASIGFALPLVGSGWSDITLEAQIEGGAIQTIWQHAVTRTDGWTRWLHAPCGVPAVTTRYRWRLTQAQGASVVTDWSAPVPAGSSSLPALTPLEA